MTFRTVLLVILFCSASANAQLPEQRYMATMDISRWTLTESNATVCRLEHQIPLFGNVIFSREAGRGLQLELNSRRKFRKGINVELRSETSSWNTRKTRSVLFRFETTGRKNLFSISPTIAERTFSELHSGYRPGFLFYDDTPVIASLSTVRFGEAASAFAQCVEQLYQYNFNDVRLSSIHFEPDNEFASIQQEETAFVKMFDYLKIDDKISEIVVTGHADRTGLACYNEGLSERRAWYVYDILIANGIDSDLLRIDYQGEQKPASKAVNKNALAANRRVTVELRR